MTEERTITQFSRMPAQRLWWSAIFGGTFFALGIMLILSLFGLAVGAAAAGPQGATQGVKIWSGIWSLVTLFVGFLLGGWVAAKASGSSQRADGRLHGVVTWALGTTAIFYFAVNSTTRLAGILAAMTGNITQLNVTPGAFENITVAAAVWGLIAAICGLIGGIIGGHIGGHREVREVTSAPGVRRVA